MKSLSLIHALVLILGTRISSAQDLSYDDLLNELHYKRARLTRLNEGGSISKKSISFGAVTSLNQVASSRSSQYPLLQGFEFGLHSDLGSANLEGRTLFRNFFENEHSQERTSLRELAFQLARSQEYNRDWSWVFGGGFSLRHLLNDSPSGNLNEVSIQINGIMGLETKISSTSRISFEAGTRFPFGVSGRDRFSVDTGIRLTTDIE